MYQIYLNNTGTMDDGELLYSDSHLGDVNPIPANGYVTEANAKSYRLISPKLSLEDCAAGSFTATVPTNNALYSKIKPIISTITVYRVFVKTVNSSTGVKTYDREWLWCGRILNVEKDYYNNKKITCEGSLAYMNDTIPSLAKYANISFLNYLKSILTVHFRGDYTTGSSYRPLNRMFHTGVIGQTSPSGAAIPNDTYFTDGTNTALSYILDAANNWGLHIRVRKGTFESQPSLLIDMLTDNLLHTCTQTVDFGSNLMDYSDKDDWSEMCTVLHPLGKTLETYNVTGDEEHKDKLTIKGKTPTSSKYQVVNNEYLVNKTAKNTYGGIEKTVEWSDIDDATTLIKMAEMYLDNYQYEAKEITIKALDLKYVGLTGIDFLNLLDRISVRSAPHGLNDDTQYFIVTKIDIPIEKPEDAVFTFSRSTSGTFGSDKTAKSGSLSTTANSTETLVGQVLEGAKQNAANIIALSSSSLRGYVTMERFVDGESGETYTNGIMITDTKDPAQARWRWYWGAGGLAYQTRPTVNTKWENGATNVAITREGQIVADFITTGTLTVSDTGNKTLFQASMTNHSVRLGKFTVQNDDLYSNSHDSYDSGITGIYIGGFTKDTVHQEGISISIGEVGLNGIMTQYSAAGMEIYSTYNTNKRTYVGRIGSIDGSEMVLVANSELWISAPTIRIHQDNSESGVYYTALNGSINVNNRDIKVVNGLLIDY